MDQREADMSDVAMGGQPLELREKVPGFVGLTDLRVALRRHRRGSFGSRSDLLDSCTFNFVRRRSLQKIRWASRLIHGDISY